jgi:hypothetical protein
VIVTQQVQDAVKNEDAHFVIDSAAEAQSVATRDGGRDGNVPEIARTIFWRRRGRSCGPSSTSPGSSPARGARRMMLATGCGFRLRAICWEGQYIGREIFATIGAIPDRYLGVGDQSDRERARREAQALARRGEKSLQAGNGNTNAALLIEDHAREISPADFAGRNGRRVRRLKRDRCDPDDWQRARRRP